MMDKNKRLWRMLLLSMISFGMVAVFLCLMFFIESDPSKEISVFSLICGIGFWVFFLSGIVLQVMLALQVHRRNNEAIQKRLGFIHFNSNKPALISDIVFGISLAVFLAFMIFTSGTSIFDYLSLSILFLSFCMHCILNGSTYAYIAKEKKEEK